MWSEKKVIKFLRSDYKKSDFRILRSVYFAICELESDMNEYDWDAGQVDLIKLLMDRSGETRPNVQKSLSTFETLKLLDYSMFAEESNTNKIVRFDCSLNGFEDLVKQGGQIDKR